jgi:hypothetical protein
MNMESLVYKHFNKLTLTNVITYLMKKINSTYEHSTYKHISKNTLQYVHKLGFARPPNIKFNFTYKLIHLYQQLQSYINFKINNLSFYSIPPMTKVLPKWWLTHLANIFYCQCIIYANTIVYFNTTCLL